MSAPEPTVLRGFTSDLRGHEGHLIFSRAVLERDGELVLWKSASAGQRGETRPLSDRDRGFVRWLDTEHPVPMAPGDGVWLAGPTLLEKLQVFPTLLLSNRFPSWAEFRGFRWTTGSRRAFEDTLQHGANLLEGELHRAFFRTDRGEAAPLRQLFELYSAFEVRDTLARSLNRALYYSETGDEHGRRLAASGAVAAGWVKTERAFDAAMQALRTRLLEKRMRELAAEPRTVVKRKISVPVPAPHDVPSRSHVTTTSLIAYAGKPGNKLGAHWQVSFDAIDGYPNTIETGLKGPFTVKQPR